MKAKEIGKHAKWIKRALLIVLMFLMLYIYGGVSYAQGIGTITALSAKIRTSADTASTVIASVEQGDKVDVTHQTSSADGYTWYKVLDGSNTGYIRADLINVEGTVPAESTPAPAPEPAPTPAPTPTAPAATVVDSDVATVKVVSATVNVRADATANSSLQGSAKKDTLCSVSGQAVGSDNVTWYQVSLAQGDQTINGFVRSDFVEVVDYVVVEESTDEPVEEVPVDEEVNNDEYYLKYTENSVGELDWYLYDTKQGTKQSLTDILKYVESTQENRANEQAQVQRYKTIAMILAAVIVVLIIVITILIFKLKDIEYVDDEEEDELEDYDDEEVVIHKSVNKDSKEQEHLEDTLEKREMTQTSTSEVEQEQKPVQSKSVQEQKPVQHKHIQQKEVIEEPKKSDTKKVRKVEDRQWQTKNFLELDDEMEFEFLDL